MCSGRLPRPTRFSSSRNSKLLMPPPRLSNSSPSHHSQRHTLSGPSDQGCWLDSTNVMTALSLGCSGGLNWRCRSWLAALLLLSSCLCFYFAAVALSHSQAQCWSSRVLSRTPELRRSRFRRSTCLISPGASLKLNQPSPVLLLTD